MFCKKIYRWKKNVLKRFVCFRSIFPSSKKWDRKLKCDKLNNDFVFFFFLERLSRKLKWTQKYSYNLSIHAAIVFRAKWISLDSEKEFFIMKYYERAICKSTPFICICPCGKRWGAKGCEKEGHEECRWSLERVGVNVEYRRWGLVSSCFVKQWFDLAGFDSSPSFVANPTFERTHRK